ncbi:MAG: DNA-binding protein [Bacteroidetes bacterium 4572_117]|nr:MAG: DNA-binding protein [Bacteroidetes bacterium 4572_117]
MDLGKNIKLLRKRKGRTQDELAGFLKMKRSTLSGYENNVAQPGIDSLVLLSEYFNISIDTLVKINLSKLSESQLCEIEKGYDVFVSGSRLRVLATTVDSKNDENIELVPEKAKAGYTRGFADPEYIKDLPVFKLPFLSKEKKYRTFQLNGDSMLPIPDKAWVTGEFVLDWNFIKNGDACIILTLNEGVVFKIIENNISKSKSLKLYSLNPIYEPYDLNINEIREIWRFVNFISNEIPEPKIPKDDLLKTVANLQYEMNKIKEKIG